MINLQNTIGLELNQEQIKTILGIEEPVYLTYAEMIRNLTLVFFPICKNTDKESIIFYDILKKNLEYLGTKIIPYEEALDIQSKIKKGVAVIAAGEGESGNLPVDHIANLRNNPVVNIVKTPFLLAEKASFEEHMFFSAKLFSKYMANVIICINENRWMVYSLNGFSPIYEIDKNFSRRIVKALVPKLAATLKPPLLSEFNIQEWDIKNVFYKPYIEDIIKASRLFKQTALYPHSKTFDSLNFRNNFYKRIGRMYLDKRSGMSYGFFVRQLIPQLSEPIFAKEAKDRFGILADKCCFKYDEKIYLKYNLFNKTFYIAVPDVWAITTRSGCEKTNLDSDKDLIMLGLINSKMLMRLPSNSTLSSNYRPSFDTKLILSQIAANAIYGSILNYFKPKSSFSRILQRSGMALAHWHTIYTIFENKPRDWYVYGIKNPAVCCSTNQTAFYSFQGKESFFTKLLFDDNEYLGDIHIEQHHGINITYPSLLSLANILLAHPQIFQLGAIKSQKILNANN